MIERFRADAVAFTTMSVAVLIAAFLPLTGSRRFYLAGDSIASWLPVSRRIGELVRAGDSHLMEPSMWRGGNYVAEAGYGLWNPLIVVLDATVLQLDDLELAAAIAKAIFLLLLAAGVYLLAREYGASSWPAAVAGVAVPVAGFTLYMDAASWSPNLAAFAFAPWTWTAARRVARGAGHPITLVVAGGLCVSAGNPYSNVVVFVIVVAVGTEVLLGATREQRRAVLITLFGALVAIGLVAIFVYLPFRQTSQVGFREAGIRNDENFAPGIGDLLGLSTPTTTPYVRNFGRSVLGFPATYLAWFVLPLAPWMRWRELLTGWRRLAGLGVFAATFFVLTLGPSHFWFFRWPIRLVPYVFLPIAIVTVVALSAGVVLDRLRARVSASAGLIAFPAYLAWADVPDDLWWHLGGALLVAAATAGAVALTARRAPARFVGPFLVVATLLTLAFQLQWRPTNESVRDYHVPSSASLLEARFADRYPGNVVQIAAFDTVPASERRPDGAYRDLAFGSLYAVANVDAMSTYSGIGFTTHDDALCLRFDGSMCAAAWDRLWQPAAGHDVPLADLLRVDTVVVQRALIDTSAASAPPGWTLGEIDDTVTVWHRESRHPWPKGLLTDVSGPVEVLADETDGPHREVVRYRRTDGTGEARLTFARLAWPGYVATLDGQPLQVGGGTAGVLQVTVPESVGDGTIVLSWTPPFWRPSILALLLGVAIGVGVEVWWWRHRRLAGRSATDGASA